MSADPSAPDDPGGRADDPGGRVDDDPDAGLGHGGPDAGRGHGGPGAVGGEAAETVHDVAAQADVVPVDLRDYVSFSTDQATRVRTLATQRLALDQWCIEPQQATGVLQYPDSDVVHTVIGGRAWFVTEQGEVGLDPLGALLVPAGTMHGIDNRGSDPLIVATAMAAPDRLAIERPDSPDGLAIRDDDPDGGLARTIRETFQRVFGR